MSNENRVPRGVPSGGQFAASRHAEAGVRLANPQGIPVSQVKFTAHMLKQAANKGFDPQQIIDAVTDPYKVTDVTRYPGQKRYCGRSGVAVVMDGNSAITCYLDGVVTEMRPDQMNDPAARNSRRLAGARH